MAKCAGVDLSTQARLAIGTVLKNQNGNQFRGWCNSGGLVKKQLSRKGDNPRAVKHAMCIWCA